MVDNLREMGIRELKAHLSEAVRDASRGTVIAVTDHGHVVATLGPPVQPDAADVRARVVALGGRAASRTFDLATPPRGPDWQPVDVAALLDDLRGER